MTCCQCIEPPDDATVATAVNRLKDLGALTKAGELTPLGRHLALLPIDVQLGKVLIYGTMLRYGQPHNTRSPEAGGAPPRTGHSRSPCCVVVQMHRPDSHGGSWHEWPVAVPRTDGQAG